MFWQVRSKYWIRGRLIPQQAVSPSESISLGLKSSNLYWLTSQSSCTPILQCLDIQSIGRIVFHLQQVQGCVQQSPAKPFRNWEDVGEPAFAERPPRFRLNGFTYKKMLNRLSSGLVT